MSNANTIIVKDIDKMNSWTNQQQLLEQKDHLKFIEVKVLNMLMKLLDVRKVKQENNFNGN